MLILYCMIRAILFYEDSPGSGRGVIICGRFGVLELLREGRQYIYRQGRRVVALCAVLVLVNRCVYYRVQLCVLVSDQVKNNNSCYHQI